MRTSLGIATGGLLDRGAKPTLSIATDGLIRTKIVDPVPYGGGGGMSLRIYDKVKRMERKKELYEEEQEILEFLCTIMPIMN